MRNDRRREGFALATAIVAIIVIGLLIAVSFFGSIQEYRTGRNSLSQERALAAAEFGQAAVLSDFNTDVARAMKTGQVATRTVSVQSGTTARIDVTRLNMLTFSVVSEGRTATGTDLEARRRTGMLIRLEVPELRIQGALTTANKTTLTGNGATSGADQNPAGWACDDSGPERAGVVNANAADVIATGGCNGWSCVTGTPKLAVDPLAGDPATYDEFGGFSYDSLAAMASVVLNTTPLSGMAPVVTGGVCNRSAPLNWGDINRNAVTPGPCESYFPIIHITNPGETNISGGTGQGILLVDGSLKLNGNFEFFGPIIVKKNLITEGTGNKVTGGVMAANEGCTTNPCNRVAGNAVIQFSRCALLATMISYARPVLATRSWADMF
ncbi:MAG TPA: hypothetical protein VMM18_05040 [Gemmatimonadaceae bacterium]|nr:hypothetical protein [Gemmatimonadaceae bacterium]